MMIPFFTLSAGFATLTIQLEKLNVGAIGPDWDFSFLDRFLIAGRVLWFYIGKLVWPNPIIFIYPRWIIDDSIWWQYIYPLAFLLLIFILWYLRKHINRGPLIAILFFAGSLFPVLGFFDVVFISYSFVADHFQYIACIGIIVIFASGVDKLIGEKRSPTVFILLTGLLVVLGNLTWNQSHIYKNVFSLWSDTTKKNPGAWMAHYNLGVEYTNSGNTSLAVRSYKLAIKYKPDHYKAHFNLGNSYRVLGRPDESIESYYNALAVNPEHVKSWINLGIILGIKQK